MELACDFTKEYYAMERALTRYVMADVHSHYDGLAHNFGFLSGYVHRRSYDSSTRLLHSDLVFDVTGLVRRK